MTLFKKDIRSVAILMCTFNGELYLKEQLDSIHNQDYKNWTLYVNDDGSSDATIEVLRVYQKKWGLKRLIIRRGPQKGFCQNFLHIINDPKIKADIYFLCDQDDIWMPNKLSRCIEKFSKLNPLKPILYCTRTKYISSNSKRILGQSTLFRKPPSFKNAIVQSIAGGNTMAFNQHLKNIVQRYPKVNVVSHDWWLYILNELIGGQTFYDHIPTILYRQHNRSLVGSNIGFIAKLKRLKMLLNGTYRLYNSKHLEVFYEAHFNAIQSNVDLINQFRILRDKSLWQRLSIINKLGLYRQTLDGQFALYLAAIFRKI